MNLEMFRKPSLSGKVKVIHKWFNKYTKIAGVGSISRNEIRHVMEKAYWGAINSSRFHDSKNKMAFRKAVDGALRKKAEWLSQYDWYVVDVLFARNGLNDFDAKCSLMREIRSYHPNGIFRANSTVSNMTVSPQGGGVTLFSDPLSEVFQETIELYRPVWKENKKGSIWLLDQANEADIRAELHIQGIPRLDVITINESTSEMADLIFCSGYESVTYAVEQTLSFALSVKVNSGFVDLESKYKIGADEFMTVAGALVRGRCELIINYYEPQLLNDFSFMEYERCCLKHGVSGGLELLSDYFTRIETGSRVDTERRDAIHDSLLGEVIPIFDSLGALYSKPRNKQMSVQEGIQKGKHYLYSFKSDITMMLISYILHEEIGGTQNTLLPFDYGVSYQVFVEVRQTTDFVMWYPCQRFGFPFNWNLFYPKESTDGFARAGVDYSEDLKDLIGWVDVYAVSNMGLTGNSILDSIKEICAKGENRADVLIFG
ncbi:hypothetical protein OTK49_21585 [Vibrio coralliirubri]|uniref:hypothetical protein n=1 Tax=Vibrio coralliirubri TaxID=1516159 RepID=UPI0022837821|nr:hypothetical protein [Vibrio coralliirubri]MCY9865115.1 hypothetical protein [Vibrio coralliirubri]